MKINVSLDRDTTFLFHLINLYSCNPTTVNVDYRKEYSHLRDPEFFSLFETLESPWIENYLLKKKFPEDILLKEKEKFDSIWGTLKKESEKTVKILEKIKSTAERKLGEAVELLNISPKFNEIRVFVVPGLKVHGMQGKDNEIFIGVKPLNEEEYQFLVFHESMHVILRETFNKLYFSEGYREELQLIEETYINFLYHRMFHPSEKLLPCWLCLKNAKHYEIFTKLVGVYEHVRDPEKFVKNARNRVLRRETRDSEHGSSGN